MARRQVARIDSVVDHNRPLPARESNRLDPGRPAELGGRLREEERPAVRKSPGKEMAAFRVGF